MPYASWPAGLGLGLGTFVRFVITFLSEVNEPGGEEATRSARQRSARASRQSGSPWTFIRTIDFSVNRAASRSPVHSTAMGGHDCSGRPPPRVRRLLLNNDPLFGFCTFYSERYSESRFNSLRVGMTREEVEAIVGPPLRKVPWNESAGSPHEEMWQYSDRRDYTANYWRRWVLFEDDKVLEIISDFWFD